MLISNGQSLARALCRFIALTAGKFLLMAIEFCSRLESEFNVIASPVTGPDFRLISRQWVERFCPNVKRKTGSWVFNGYRWHAYSFHYETAISGIRAFEQYQSKPIQPFFVLQESGDRIFACSGERWPDLRALDDDIYVFPRTMEWTFVTTHEMSIGLGPYFALAPTESIAMPSTEAP